MCGTHALCIHFTQYGGLLCANVCLAASLRHMKDNFCIYGYHRRSSISIQQNKSDALVVLDVKVIWVSRLLDMSSCFPAPSEYITYILLTYYNKTMGT